MDSNDDQLAKQRGDHRAEADTARPDAVESKDEAEARTSLSRQGQMPRRTHLLKLIFPCRRRESCRRSITGDLVTEGVEGPAITERHTEVANGLALCCLIRLPVAPSAFGPSGESDGGRWSGVDADCTATQSWWRHCHGHLCQRPSRLGPAVLGSRQAHLRCPDTRGCDKQSAEQYTSHGGHITWWACSTSVDP
jgi:hypothetical protein